MNKIRMKLSGWNCASLSQGRRLALIKSVLSAMLVYVLQVLSPPKAVLQEIESIFARFLWGSSIEKKRVHWTRWRNVCYPVNGGLGVMKLKDMAKAFSYKL